MDFQFSEYISPVLRSGRLWWRKRCFLGQCTWCRGWRCIFTTRGVYSKNWRVMTIQKQVMREHCHFTNVAIRIHEPSPPRIIIPAPQIVQPRFLIKHIPAIPKRLRPAQRFRQFAGTPQRRAPRIIHITNNNISIRIKNCNDSTGKHRRCDTTAAVRIFLKPLRELECSNSLPFLLKRRCLLG